MLVCVSLFWPGMIAGEVPSFRDAFHFYYPQSVWLDQCALQGDYFPSWQCNEALGVNVAGETTSALYYPLRIIWFLPCLSVAQRYAAFVIVHLLLAALGIQYACSRLRLREEAGWLAGASFALSCPVLFQHTNIVYLSSAAWLGFAIAELYSWLYRGDPDSLTIPHSVESLSSAPLDPGAPTPRLALLSLSIAMMVLAGDPHTAVNLCILAVALAIARAVSKRSAVWFERSMLWLAAAVLFAVGLSAVQSIQSLHWANQSYRWLGDAATTEQPKTQPEQHIAPENSIPNQLATILAERTSRPAGAVYEFSLSPWHVLTALWPTLGGSYAPENSRLFSYVSAEGRMWIPSLFLGIVPLLLLVGGFRRPANPKYSLFLLGAIFALLASFGNYSLGWLVRNAFDVFGAASISDQLAPDHYSGLYGMLVEWLPGYGVFRYPAKWSVITVACAAIASAIRFDQLCDKDLTRRSRLQFIVLVTSSFALLVTIAFSKLFTDCLATRSAVASDAWIGTPQSKAILGQLLFAFSMPLLVIGLLAVVRWRQDGLKHHGRNAKLPVHALVAWIGLLESFIVATCWCSFVPAKQLDPAGPTTSKFVWSDTSEANIERDQWLTTATTNGATAIDDYQQEFALGKLGLLANRHNLATLLSLEPLVIKRLRNGLAKVDDLSTTQPELDVMLAWLGVEQRLVRSRDSNQRAAFSWQPIPNPKQLCELQFGSQTDAMASESTSSLKWQWLRCGQLEIEINCPAPCRLMVRQLNEGGWYAVTDRGDSPQVTTDQSGLFVECSVEAGKSTLRLERIQWPMQLGLSISFATLLFAIGSTAFNFASHRRLNRDQNS